MNLPNLDNVELPKRVMAGLTAMYLIRDIVEFRQALVAYCFIAFVIGCQTLTDLKGKSQPKRKEE